MPPAIPVSEKQPGSLDDATRDTRFSIAQTIMRGAHFVRYKTSYHASDLRLAAGKAFSLDGLYEDGPMGGSAAVTDLVRVKHDCPKGSIEVRPPHSVIPTAKQLRRSEGAKRTS